MKRASVLLISVLAFGILACSYGEWGSERSGHKRVVFPAGEVHEGWYFAGGDQVSLLGTINGDTYVAGGTVDVDGTINGQLIVAGGQVTVSGNVTDRVIATGGTVRITGKIGKSVIAAGGMVDISRGAAVGDNVLAAGGTIQIGGVIEHEAKVAGGNVTVTGNVKGSLDVTTERFGLYKGGLVGGNLTVEAKDTANVTVEPGTVLGSVRVTSKEQEAPTHILGMKPGRFCFQVFFGLTLFGTALLLSFLLPGHLTAPATTLLRQPGQSIIWGFIALVLTPVLCLVLLLTVIGIPVGLFLFAAYLWFLYVSQLVLGAALGARMMGVEGKRGWRLFGTVAAGLLVVEILMLIPWVRILVILAGLIAGLGAMAIATKQGWPRVEAGQRKVDPA